MIGRLPIMLTLLVGCSTSTDIVSTEIDASDMTECDMSSWEGHGTLGVSKSMLEAHPKVFGRISRYYTHVTGDVRPDVGHRGAFGTGNGYVFGFVGLTDPLNTLHSLIGPTYEKRDGRFFGDYALYLNEETFFEEEWAGRSLSAPVVFTRGRRGDLELETFDFAPISDGDDRHCFVRLIVVRNTGSEEVGGIKLIVRPANPVSSADGKLIERTKNRSLVTRFSPLEGVADGRLVLDLGKLMPATEISRTLLHCTFDGEPGDGPDVDAHILLEKLAEAYELWEQRLVDVSLPDPMVEDFIEGMKMTLKVQTSAQGATCPMSEYTRTWARDNIGPVMAMLDFGGGEDVAGMLDYVYAAIRYKGDLQNSYDADLDPEKAPPPPDWDTMPELEGKVAAETPSYMVMMYALYHRFTGDISRVSERFGLLRRCLMRQRFNEDYLLPFTGDETFREAMNAALGMTVLDYPHHELSWSANSSMLWLGAEKEFERLALATGRVTDKEAAGSLRPLVEQAFYDHYVLPDGCVSPFIDKATMKAAPGPFEDVALQVVWSAWMNGDAPFARSSLSCLLKHLRVAPGIVQSPVSQNYPLYDLIADSYGIYTGMLPGYTLAVLTETGHEEALDAFNAVRLSLDSSGNLQEYMLYADHSGLSLVYDPNGGIGDYTAKFRPWEGGIVLDAVMRYLIGFWPDATERTINFRPHLPNCWPYAHYKGLRVGSDRFDVSLYRTASGVTIHIISRATSDYLVSLRWDDTFEPSFSVDGKQIDELERFSHFGLVSAKSPPLPLRAGSKLVIDIGPANH